MPFTSSTLSWIISWEARVTYRCSITHYSYSHSDIPCVYIYILYKCMYAHLIMVKYIPCSSCGWNKSIWEPTVQLDQGLTREHYIKRQQLFIPTTRISNFTYYETNPEPFQNSHQIGSKIFKKNIFPSSHSNVNKYCKCPTPSSSSLWSKLQSWFCWDFRCLDLKISPSCGLWLWMQHTGCYPDDGLLD